MGAAYNNSFRNLCSAYIGFLNFGKSEGKVVEKWFIVNRCLVSWHDRELDRRHTRDPKFILAD